MKDEQKNLAPSIGEIIKNLRTASGMTPEQLGVSSQLSPSYIRKLEGGMRHDITNVNGGAVALGHPTGCSGARILVTLLHEMRRRAAEHERPYYGLATLCVGVGMGVSTVIEWLDA